MCNIIFQTPLQIIQFLREIYPIRTLKNKDIYDNIFRHSLLYRWYREYTRIEEGRYPQSIPVAIPSEEALETINCFHSYVLWFENRSFLLKNVGQKLMPIYFGNILDDIIWECFFPNICQMAGPNGRLFVKYLQSLPNLQGEEEDVLYKLEKLFSIIYHKDHPVRNADFYLDSISVYHIIRKDWHMRFAKR